MTLPSEKLLSEVLGKKVEKRIVRDNNIICFTENIAYKDVSLDAEKPINIHELAHNKCKEWAYFKFNITIKSYTLFNAGACELKDKMGFHLETFDAKTEPEAIFKACEWIMENTKC